MQICTDEIKGTVLKGIPPKHNMTNTHEALLHVVERRCALMNSVVDLSHGLCRYQQIGTAAVRNMTGCCRFEKLIQTED